MNKTEIAYLDQLIRRIDNELATLIRFNAGFNGSNIEKVVAKDLVTNLSHTLLVAKNLFNLGLTEEEHD